MVPSLTKSSTLEFTAFLLCPGNQIIPQSSLLILIETSISLERIVSELEASFVALLSEAVILPFLIFSSPEI